jgi:regulator of sigma E protease
MAVLLLVLGILLFVGLVIVHEWGHFIVARRNGVVVEEFGIGFPPRAWKRKMKSGFLFTLNWLPLGGFVKLKGEHDADREPGTYGAANLGAKVRIMMAGVGMNLLTAFFMFTILALVGMPRLVENQFTVKSDTKVASSQVLVGMVEDDSPAQKAGIQTRDQILQVGSGIQNCTQSAIGPNECSENLDEVKSAEQLPKLTEQYAGKTVPITIKRDGKTIDLTVTLRSEKEVEASKKTSNPKGYLGVSPTEYTLQRSTWSAPIVAGGIIGQFTALTFNGLGHAIASLFQGNASEAGAQVAGPVGIFAILKTGTLLGFQFVLFIIAIISLTLAIINALPIPALDGGRLFVTLLFRALKKPLKPSTEDKIHGTGFAALMLLFVVITIVDIKRFF